jgi:antitoxin PrlF
MSEITEKYAGKVTPVGNSKGIRLDAAFFKAHPEFKGEVRATVLADGQVLLSAKPGARKARAGESEDPVVLGFLRFLERELQARPGDIVPAGERQLKRIGKLVAGVKAG